MQCLTEGGHVFISDEIAEKLMARFAKRAEDRGVFVEVVPTGTIQQLHELVKLVDAGAVSRQFGSVNSNQSGSNVTNRLFLLAIQIEPPPHTVFPSEQAAEVVRKLASSEIPGRAILKFHDVE